MSEAKKILTEKELKEILDGLCPTMLTREELNDLARQIHAG